MKKGIVILMMILITLSPFFRGLFFPYESYVFLSATLMLSILYLLNKLSLKEKASCPKYLIPVACLILLAYVLAFASAVNPRENMDSIVQQTTYLLIMLVLYDFYMGRAEMLANTLMLSVAAVGFLCALIGIEALTKAFAFLDVTLHDDRIGSTFQYYNAAAAFFVLSLFFTLALVHTSQNKWYHHFLPGIGCTLFMALVLTGSKGAFLVAAILLLLFIAFSPAGWRLKAICSMLSMFIPAFLFLKRVSSCHSTGNYLSITLWTGLAFLAAVMLQMLFQMILKAISGKKVHPAFWLIGLALILIAFLVLWLNRNKLYAFIPASILTRWEGMSFDNSSFAYRITFNMDALKLISDHWLTGLGGGGWTALYQSVQDNYYTARAVHNQYLQLFVEGGILGFLSYAALTLLSVVYAIKSVIKARSAELRMLSTGLCMGFLALAMHSAIDFDLSYVSLSMIFYALIAAISLAKDAFKMRDGENPVSPHPRLGTSPVLLILCICALVLTFSSRYAISAYHANKGIISIEAGDYASAVNSYEKAYPLDSRNSQYSFQLSKLYLHHAKLSTKEEDRKIWLNKAIQIARESIRNNPFYPAHHEMLFRICDYAGRPLDAVESAEKLVRYQPAKEANYDILARIYLEAAKWYKARNELIQAEKMVQLCVQVDDLAGKPVAEGRYASDALALLESN